MMLAYQPVRALINNEYNFKSRVYQQLARILPIIDNKNKITRLVKTLKIFSITNANIEFNNINF